MDVLNSPKDLPHRLTQPLKDSEIEYLQYPGPGKTLILLPATGFPPELWHPIALELSQDYRVIVPFYYDHREADSGGGVINWLLLAGDLKEFCDRLKVDNPLVVGHSIGGTVAVIAEAECGLAASGLILLEPIFLMEELYGRLTHIDKHPVASKTLKRTQYWGDEEELRRYLKSKPLFQSWAEGMLETYIRSGFQPDPLGGIRLRCSPFKEAALLMGGMKNNPWPMFPRIACPVLVLEGETSENRLYTKLEKASSLMPWGSYALVQDAGHLIPMERPKEVTTVIMNFLREVHY